jgi:hypothetical protein
MPQDIDAGLLTRFQSKATSAALMLLVIRKDGEVYACSTATREKEWLTPQGTHTYLSGGFDPTNITTTFSEGIAGVELIMYFQGVLTQADVRQGKFDGAVAYMYWGDWSQPDLEALPIFSGYILSSGVTNQSVAKFVLTGQMQKALKPLGEVRQANCRAMFGDDRCKFPIEDHVLDATVTSLTGNILTLDVTTPLLDDGDHLLWRVHMSVAGDPPEAGQAAPAYTEITLLEIRPTVGGASYIITGAVDGASTDFEYGSPPSSDAWQGNTWTGQVDTWNGILLNAPGPAREFVLRAGNAFNAPRSVWLEYSDNGADIRGGPWTEAIGYRQSGLVWTDDETKVFSRAGGDVQASYDAGLVKFTAGANIGEAFDIIEYSQVGDIATVRLAIVPTRAVEVGEAVLVYPGCDKTLQRCKYWANVINFRGEPYIPTATFQGQNRLIT